MQTVGDISLEELYSLGDEVEKKCESKYHTTGIDGHADSPLWYVMFTGDCKCNSGVHVRCISWINRCQFEMEYYQWDSFECPDCKGEWNMKPLEPVR